MFADVFYLSTLSFLEVNADIIVHWMSNYYGLHKVSPVDSCDTYSWWPNEENTGERVAYQIMLMLRVLSSYWRWTITYEGDSVG